MDTGEDRSNPAPKAGPFTDYVNASLAVSICIAMHLEFQRWCTSVVETIDIETDYLTVSTSCELLIPTSHQLAALSVPAYDKPPSGPVRIVIPVFAAAKREQSRILEVESDGLAIRVMPRSECIALADELRNIFANASANSDKIDGVWGDSFTATNALVGQSVVQYVEMTVELGQRIAIKYVKRSARSSHAVGTLSQFRVALGWRQRSFLFDSTMPMQAQDYTFQFHCPDEHFVRSAKLQDGISDVCFAAPIVDLHAASIHSTLNEVTLDVGSSIDKALPVPDVARFAIECYERPPGSLGRASVVGFVALLFSFFIALALHRSVEFDGAAALLAGLPAILAANTPGSEKQDGPIKPPLTARLTLWLSTITSVLCAFMIATNFLNIERAILLSEVSWSPYVVALVIWLLLWILTRILRMIDIESVREVTVLATVAFAIWFTYDHSIWSFRNFIMTVLYPVFTLLWLRCILLWIEGGIRYFAALRMSRFL
ncbi:MULTISPECIES: hypothetical protein [unclassified Rhodococcus (in: high G+C Gram-positive bacteria)]|uniref:hypothetical protein n=1 Tax=unclassified Rhodococcus (in: high G+C Gram-positive bacteria) TaxID=192944 RepID=UPI00117B6F08|nr:MULTISPECIES: hypothetical protein [unclassified Rhodococcus (in: high G+C Gram-positive bacteria)]